MIPILEVKDIMIMNKTGWQVMESDFFFDIFIIIESVEFRTHVGVVDLRWWNITPCVKNFFINFL